MEPDIIVEGLTILFEKHKIIVEAIVADGDTSVLAAIQKKVEYGNEVEKYECRNHVVKNFGKALRKIKEKLDLKSSVRKLLGNIEIEAFQKTINKILSTNAKEEDVDNLMKDFKNLPFHVFGNHSNCSDYYCDSLGEIDKDISTTEDGKELIYYIEKGQ